LLSLCLPVPSITCLGSNLGYLLSFLIDFILSKALIF
jgi:hypothetical protein